LRTETPVNKRKHVKGEGGCVPGGVAGEQNMVFGVGKGRGGEGRG